MFADLDYDHPEVKADVLAWGKWLVEEMGIFGIRFDAVKHFSEEFLREFCNMINTVRPGWFFVGEFWKDSLQDMSRYLDRMHRKFSLFDAPLVHKFSEISKTEEGDLASIFENTLVKMEPVNAVTLVMNHDTQPYQALEAPIEPFFKALAYALILLRYDGYPAIFYGDLYGIDPNGEKQSFGPSCGNALARFTLARKLYAYGTQRDYFDYRICVGWVRYGTWDRPSGCAVVMSNAGAGEKRMDVGRDHAGEVWTDVLGWNECRVTIDTDGFGNFWCSAISVSIYVNEQAEGRDRFEQDFDSDIYGKVW